MKVDKDHFISRYQRFKHAFPQKAYLPALWGNPLYSFALMSIYAIRARCHVRIEKTFRVHCASYYYQRGRAQKDFIHCFITFSYSRR
jgi:hypothetical protein